VPVAAAAGWIYRRVIDRPMDRSIREEEPYERDRRVYSRSFPDLMELRLTGLLAPGCDPGAMWAVGGRKNPETAIRLTE
jgi:hypothetical protein